MDHYDLKHCTQEDTIEFEILSNLSDEKKPHFKDGEPVRFMSIGDEYAIASLNNDTRVVKVKPTNAHYKSIVDGILGRGRVCLTAVINNTKKLLQVSFKQFSEEKTLSYAINVSEDFFSSVRRSVNLNNISNPKKDIEEGTLYKAGGYTYAVIGVHARADENQQFKRFIVVGRDFYIQVNKIEEDLGQEYYVAEKVFKKIKSDDYYFFLAKGQLKYTTDREKIALETKAVMESLADDTYIKIWDEYGEIERETILQEARDFGALRYTSYEQIGRDYRFDISSDNPERFSAFAKKFERGDILAASIMNPFDVQRENQEFEEYLDKHKNYIANIRLAEDIDPSSGSVIFTVDDQEARKISVAQQGYIFVSIMGDKKRLDRREQARTKIESRQCPMPNLSAVLEGKSVSAANRTKRDYPALSDSVIKEIFTKKGKYQPPTQKQEMAIAMALNTPDIALIQGPPGTGKTTVITAILKRLNEIADPTGGMFGRDLVTAFQHDAVQNAIDRIEILGLPAIKFGHKYNETEDDIVEINAAIQGWINDRLSDLYTCHSDLDSKKYLTEFNKLYVDYLYSANSIDQTLDLLERVRDLVDIRVSSELLDELSDEISDLQLMTGRTAGATTNLLVRAVRRLPASEIAFEDNGRFEMQRAVYQLRKQRNTEFDTEIKQIQKMLDSEEYDFESLKLIRKKLLIKVLPKQDIFTAPNKKDDIVRLLGRISDYLLNQIEGGKDGEDLVIMQYMQSLEEDPLAVKQAILNYSAVNGATNQQVMRKEIADLKDGEIVFDNVLVDEAARSNPLDLFIPLSVAKDRIILVGDHRQLPHIIVVFLEYDNSYELTLKPVNGRETAFKEIVVEWANTDRKANILSIWPPATNKAEASVILLEIEETQRSFVIIKDSIEKHFVNYPGYGDKTVPIKNTSWALNKNIFKLRNIVLSGIPEAEIFLDSFIQSDLYKYIGQLAGIFKSASIPDSFYSNNESRELSFLRGDCMQVMFSVGKYTPEVIQKYFVSHYTDYDERSRTKALVDMLLCNGHNHQAIGKLIDDVRNANNDDTYSIRMDALVKELSRMCCFDSDLVYDFYDADPSFMTEMALYVVASLRKQLAKCERVGENYKPRKQDVKRYIAYMLAILTLLRLRDPDRAGLFPVLEVASDNSKKLARELRILDDYMSKERPINPAIRFKLNKPDSLSKMSDLCYALDLYLNGDKQAASIEVVGVDEDD